jgi:phenylalanyl-tRNA synthetase beta chain
VGVLGEPDADARKSFDLPAELPVMIAELDLEALPVTRESALFEPLPRYPGVLRDLAFVVDGRRRHEEVAEAVRGAAGDLLAEVRLFDVYEGPPLADDERSLAYTLVFRSPERSLTHEEVDAVVDRIVRHLGESLGARIR